MKKSLSCFSVSAILIVLIFGLMACQNKTFNEYRIHEILGSNGDTYSRKISNDYFFTHQRYDSTTYVYWIPSPDCVEIATIAINSVDRILVCSGAFDKYGDDGYKLYFVNSTSNMVTIIDKETRNIEVLSISTFEFFNGIFWYDV